jgi:hypothetical protein
MASYEDSVFVNVPFDGRYVRLSDAFRAVRDWLSNQRSGVLTGGKTISERYGLFRADLPLRAGSARLDHRELTFGDYTRMIVAWLASNPW